MPTMSALVCGGGRGIGRAIALALADEAFSIALIAKTERELQETSDMIRQKGVECYWVVADLTSYESTHKAIEEICQRFNGLSALINCVGWHPTSTPIDEYPIDYWHSMLDVNLSSVFYACRVVVPYMKKQHFGRIINIASVAGKIGVPNACAYVAAKHGVVGLTKVLALELGHYSITANAICPGFVETRMTEHKHELRKLVISRSAIPRVVEADEVAALAVYLAKEKSGSITGQAFNVCCGFVI